MPEEVKPAAQETPQAAAATSTEPAKETTPPVQAEKVEPKAEPAKAPEETKATEKPAEQKPVVPEKYELKLPEGAHVSAEHVETVAAFAKERGLSQEQAQAVLERENAAVGHLIQTQQTEFEAKKVEWFNSAKADKEVGGEDFAKNAELSKRFIEKFASPEMKTMLEASGFGNHPEVVRTFVRAAKAMGEDELVLPGALDGQKPRHADVLFGQKK